MWPDVALTVMAVGFKSPLQYSVTLDGLIVGAAGTGFTVTVCWSVPIHPLASVPVTE